MNRILKNIQLIILLAPLFLPLGLVAQNEADNFNIDSTIYNYYQHCKEHINDTIVLSMTDTLFMMAKEKGDKRMQAVALSTNLDYFYYRNNEEMIKKQTALVKQFSKTTNQPKYYYFAWSRRLIQYYINQGKFTIALYEAEKMLKEATQEDYKEGIAACSKTLSLIYAIRSQSEQAFKYLLEEVELTEKYNLENYNIALSYKELSSYYSKYGKYKEALECLKKAEAKANTINHRLTIKTEYINYYLAINEYDKALKMLEEVRLLFNNEKSLKNSIRYIYATEVNYYTTTKDYPKALNAINLQINEAYKRGEQALIPQRLKTKAEIFWNTNQADSASIYYRRYIQITDSLRILSEEKSAGEFASLLNIEKLNNENSELVLKAQEQELEGRKTFIFSLIILLVILCFFIYRERLMIRKLIKSECELQQKNKALIVSQEELRISKDIAEEASRMKTLFIQNISHEIRTPLNSIVGFSQVLTNLTQDNDEAKEYSDIITTNSNNLLKLITDVLNISNLETHEDPLILEETNINLCCLSCIESVTPLLQDGVILDYLPDTNSSVSTIKTSPEGLSQILNNLLHNAAKFTKKGEISLSYTISQENNTVTFNVKDTGLGIPANMRDAIFERFIKLDEFSQGTGLGLPISKLYAEKMNSTLLLDYDYSNGCSFILTIPFC